MTRESDIRFCFGNRAARELLAVAKTVLADPDSRDAEVVRMAEASLKTARTWLFRCAECRSQRLGPGAEPCCAARPQVLAPPN